MTLQEVCGARVHHACVESLWEAQACVCGRAEESSEGGEKHAAQLDWVV